VENVHAAIVERACFDPTVAGDEQRWFRCCVNVRCCRVRGEGNCDCWEGDVKCLVDDSDNAWGEGWIEDGS
jgi:hypothetical protein